MVHIFNILKQVNIGFSASRHKNTWLMINDCNHWLHSYELNKFLESIWPFQVNSVLLQLVFIALAIISITYNVALTTVVTDHSDIATAESDDQTGCTPSSQIISTALVRGGYKKKQEVRLTSCFLYEPLKQYVYVYMRIFFLLNNEEHRSNLTDHTKRIQNNKHKHILYIITTYVSRPNNLNK